MFHSPHPRCYDNWRAKCEIRDIVSNFSIKDPIVCCLIRCITYLRRWWEWSWSSGVMMISRGKPNKLNKTLIECHLVHYEYRIKSPGIEAGAPWWKAGAWPLVESTTAEDPHYAVLPSIFHLGIKYFPPALFLKYSKSMFLSPSETSRYTPVQDKRRDLSFTGFCKSLIRLATEVLVRWVRVPQITKYRKVIQCSISVKVSIENYSQKCTAIIPGRKLTHWKTELLIFVSRENVRAFF